MTTDGAYERRMSDTVDRLTKAGYSDSFRGEAGGVRDLHTGHLHPPEELVIESVDRFEGITDPQEESMVMAVRCTRDACRGTYIVPYGMNMSAVDGDLIARIPDARPR